MGITPKIAKRINCFQRDFLPKLNQRRNTTLNSISEKQTLRGHRTPPKLDFSSPLTLPETKMLRQKTSQDTSQLSNQSKQSLSLL